MKFENLIIRYENLIKFIRKRGYVDVDIICDDYYKNVICKRHIYNIMNILTKNGIINKYKDHHKINTIGRPKWIYHINYNSF